MINNTESTFTRVKNGRKYRSVRWARLVVILGFIVSVAFSITLVLGQSFTSPSDVLSVLLGNKLPGASFVVGQLRLPRAVISLLVGMSFGMAGVAFQIMLRNPLASPDIIGVSAGATAAAVFAITMLHLDGASVALFSISMGLLVALSIYSLSYRNGVTGTRLILIGIGVSAMIESIEGKRGLPRHRPPYIAEVGVFGRPTLNNNVETLYWVPTILDKGAKWFADQGKEGHPGMRSWSVSGRVKKPGVVGAPAGVTIRELIDDQCGGMLDGHTFKAYLPGGASGGILPAKFDDVPLDFGGKLAELGSFVGSHAIVVFSDQDNIKDAALNLLDFFTEESCGQCTPCRGGTEKMGKLLRTEGKLDEEAIRDLEDVMRDASICGLGQAAPNPINHLLVHFQDDL